MQSQAQNHSRSLEEIFVELNSLHFGGRLAPPSLAWNPRLSSTAGRFTPGSRNPLRPRAPLIEIAAYLSELADGAMHVSDTMLHEMIHYQLWADGKPYGHTEEFHCIMKRVGAKRYNPVPKTRPFKHWYECPECRKRIPARRKIGNSACMDCCRNFAGGRYDRRFRLELVMSDGVCLEEEFEVTTVTPSSPPAINVEPEEPRLPPSEIIRRLEELKQMVLGKLGAKV